MKDSSPRRRLTVKNGILGSQRKTAVLVMAESSVPTNTPMKKYSIGKRVGHIKMEVIPDLKAATEEDRIKNSHRCRS